MATHIGIGFSSEANASTAAGQAATQALEQIQQDKIDLVIVLNTIHYSPLETLITVRKSINAVRVIGSSTAGIILSEMISLRGVAVLAITSDEMNFGIAAMANIDTQDRREAGAAFARNVIADYGQHRRQAFVFFIDGLIQNNSPFTKGIQEIFGNIFPVVGAGSTDDFHFRKTYQYCQDKSLEGAATGVLIGGANIRVGLGNKHGWKPLGKPRYITQVEGNVIKTIDQKRALTIYEEFFGDEAKNLKSQQLTQLAILYPLGASLPEEKEYLIRNPIGITGDGSIICQGEVPEDAEIHIMIGNKDACRQAAVAAAQEAKEALGEKSPQLAFVFECMGRQKLLGRDAHREIQLIRQTLGQEVPIFGMYCWGEISPFKTAETTRRSHLQNESITVMAIA